MADHESIALRISASCPPQTQQILTAAWSHDIAAINRVLDSLGKASIQDPVTGETPLHAAIRACGSKPEDGDDDDDVSKAAETVRQLLEWGAIWNDVDDHDETPGCVALRLGRPALYELCVDAGVRAEMLFGLLDGYEELLSDGYEELLSNGGGTGESENGWVDDDGQMTVSNGDKVPQLVKGAAANGDVSTTIAVTDEGLPAETGAEAFQMPCFVRPKKKTYVDVKSDQYLGSKLTYSNGKLVDDAGNGVMMAWETDIMRRSVDALLPNLPPGKRILNIGFGLGIVDTMFAETRPSRHHIVEAHPQVLHHMASPSSPFGAAWESRGPSRGAFKVHAGKWQDVCQSLLQAGEVYDVVYFDTFGEDYAQLRSFVDLVPGLLDARGAFGFFNGLGADRRVCYDVYARVVELHLADAGLDVDWTVVDVNMDGLADAGRGEWEGVNRRYWTLDKYRLPVCTFLG